MSRPKYINACLRVIQMECEKHDFCTEECCFYDVFNGCRITLNTEIPCYWNLEEEHDGNNN